MDKRITVYIVLILLIAGCGNSAENHIHSGNEYFQTGEYELAIEDYSKAIKQSSKNAGAFYGRARAYGMLGDYEQALADFGQAIKYNPELA